MSTLIGIFLFLISGIAFAQSSITVDFTNPYNYSEFGNFDPNDPEQFIGDYVGPYSDPFNFSDPINVSAKGYYCYPDSDFPGGTRCGGMAGTYAWEVNLGNSAFVTKEATINLTVADYGYSSFGGVVRMNIICAPFILCTNQCSVVGMDPYVDSSPLKFNFNVPISGGAVQIRCPSDIKNIYFSSKEISYVFVKSITLRSTRYQLSLQAGTSSIVDGTPVELKPSVFSTPSCRLSNFNSTQSFSVKCVDSTTQEPVAGCAVKAEISLGSNDGGHSHGNESTRPLGEFLPAEVEESSLPISIAGTVFRYQAPEIAQELIVKLSGKDPLGGDIKSMEFKLVVRASGSENWVPLSNEYVYVINNGADTNPSHPMGQFGTQEMAATILRLGRDYVQSLSPLTNVPPILSQAASLPMGGLYDINKNWQSSHCGHRDGETIDLSLHNLSSYEKILLSVAARDNSLGFFYTPEGPENRAANHWHATLR